LAGWLGDFDVDLATASPTAKPAFYNNSAIDIPSRSFVNQSLLLMDDGRIGALSRGTLDRTALRFAEGNKRKALHGL
jgi:hypothetical protein